MRPQNKALRHFLLVSLRDHPEDITALAAKKFGITRQAVNRHLRELTDDGLIRAAGNTRQRRYELVADRNRVFQRRLPGLREDAVWRDEIQPLLADLPVNVLHIWNYGFTEMLNNAIDHSDGKTAEVEVLRDYSRTRIIVTDDGVGIFHKIKHALHLDNEWQAVLELAKGKLTTDETRHTGEGIFFTSRTMDRFVILSGEVHFSHDTRLPDDEVRENPKLQPGTKVIMYLSNHAKQQLDAVFDAFASPDGDYGFSHTVVPVRIAQHPQDMLVSRSQAKRLLNRFDRFKTVMLDFEGVDSIGQAFADEIFRVYANAHPAIELKYEHANKSVTRMIKRAQMADAAAEG